ncbi:hypothetical protein GW17_00034655 [Ensete ventricosum]|nr:hypothetical protein GW17_00034655 [Ensete ventricosum]
MGGTYRSARLPVHGPPATGRFHQKSTVGGRFKGEIDRRRSIEGEIDHWRSIEREKGRKKKKRKKKKKKEKKRKNTYRPRAVLARAPSSLARCRRSRVVAACGSPAPVRRRRLQVAGALSPARGERSRRHEALPCFVGERHLVSLWENKEAPCSHARRRGVASFSR